jgi:DHA1 family quinolone resistance protein-like MFS transporter
LPVPPIAPIARIARSSRIARFPHITDCPYCPHCPLPDRNDFIAVPVGPSVRIQTIQMLTNAGGFASSLFVPILLRQEMGADDYTVGLIVSLFGAATFMSQYMFGRAADNRGKRLFLLAGLVISAVAVALQALAQTAAQMAVARFLVGLASGIYPPALLAYTYISKQQMGKSVSYGSLGWGVGTFVAGVIAAYWAVFLASGVMFFLAFLIALGLPPIKDEKLHNVPLFPKAIIKKNLPIYSSLLIRHAGASAIWATLPIYISQMGASNLDIGIIYACNALTQFFVMYNLDKMDSGRVYLIGLVLSAFTFVAYGLVERTHNYWYFIVPQMMIAFSWSFMYVGALRFVAERNAEVATSTGHIGAVIALAGIFGPLIGGFVSGWAGNYTTMMFFSAVITVAAIGIFMMQKRNGNPAPS